MNQTHNEAKLFIEELPSKENFKVTDHDRSPVGLEVNHQLAALRGQLSAGSDRHEPENHRETPNYKK